MILIDYSQVSLSTIFQFQKDLKKGTKNEDAINIIRHAILSGLKYYKQKFGQKYGNMVLACDGKNYWRRELFPHYKANRKSTRDRIDLDWDLVFNTISDIKNDIAEHFPYSVLHFDNVEADDIIAVLCKWTQTNGFVDHGIFEEKQPVMIVSSDGDFKQLHKYANVDQWSPIQKKLVDCSNPTAYLIEHTAKGDSGDGIPNVLSPDAVFITEGIRQSKMTAKKLENFMINGRDGCETDEERRNWDRNNLLINFEMIPYGIQETIINTFVSNPPKGNKMSIYNYLVKNRCRLLLDDIEGF